MFGLGVVLQCAGGHAVRARVGQYVPQEDDEQEIAGSQVTIWGRGTACLLNSERCTRQPFSGAP